MDDLKIKILEDDIATLKNLRGSEVTMNEELKAYNKKLELSVESLITKSNLSNSKNIFETLKNVSSWNSSSFTTGLTALIVNASK